MPLGPKGEVYRMNPQVAQQAEAEGEAMKTGEMAGMESEFPHVHNEGKVQDDGQELTYSWVNTRNERIDESRPILTPEEVVELVQARMDRFASAPPGARESDGSRGDRKHIAAHAQDHEDVLRQAWKQMDDDQRMEFEMMLDMRSHQGLEGAEELGKATGMHGPVGDDSQPLDAAEQAATRQQVTLPSQQEESGPEVQTGADAGYG